MTVPSAGFQPSLRFLLVETLLWLGLVLISWWWTLGAAESGLRGAIVYTSIISILAGIRAFLGHGHAQITATGLFGLSTAMFIGYSGLELASQATVDPPWKYLALACTAGLTAQVVTTMLAWRRNDRYLETRSWFPSAIANWGIVIGVLVTLAAMGVQIAVPSWQAWTAAAAFTAICFLSAGLILRDDARMLSWRLLPIGASLILYSEFFHEGTGRLLLVALACAIGVMYAARFRYRMFKIAIVALLPIALWWMAIDRLALEESLTAGASAGRTGLESLIAPLSVFGLLLEALHEHGFEPANGYNLLSVPALFIPESIWPEQPIALGYEVVKFDAPELYGDGIFSTVVSSAGEGIYNFGWWGLPIIIVFAALFLRLVDRFLLSRLDANRDTLLGLLGLVLAAMLAGAIADYTWSGVHTYGARMLVRMPFFLFICVLAMFSGWRGTKLDFRKRPPLRAEESDENEFLRSTAAKRRRTENPTFEDSQVISSSSRKAAPMR